LYCYRTACVNGSAELLLANYLNNSEIIASFPGSHAPEHEHWGMESLVFFVTWKAVKVERR